MYFCFSVKVNWDNSKFSNDLYCLQLNNNNAKNISNLHHFYSTNKEISIYWWCWRHILHRTIKNPNFRSICHDHHLHVGFLSDSLSGFPSAIFRSFPKWIHNINIKKKIANERLRLWPFIHMLFSIPLTFKTAEIRCEESRISRGIVSVPEKFPFDHTF